MQTQVLLAYEKYRIRIRYFHPQVAIGDTVLDDQIRNLEKAFGIGKKYLTEKPIWNGEKNKSVLVWKEQGVGDEIMYNSILPELKAISKKLIVYCDKRLIPLFNRSFSKDVIFESNKININNIYFLYGLL